MASALKGLGNWEGAGFGQVSHGLARRALYPHALKAQWRENDVPSWERQVQLSRERLFELDFDREDVPGDDQFGNEGEKEEGILARGPAMPRTQRCAHAWGRVRAAVHPPYFSFLAHSRPALVIELSIMTNTFCVGIGKA